VSVSDRPATFAALTTLRLGGPITKLVDAATPADLIAALTPSSPPCVLLGEGSNTVAPDAGAPVVVRPRWAGIDIVHEDPTTLLLRVGAGMRWADLVDRAVGEGWSGFEALAGIPGSVGAAPVQNIGAYGHEVGELIDSVVVWDRLRGSQRTLRASDLAFGYRTSAIKASLDAGLPRWVVLTVVLRTRLDPRSAPVTYPELARTLGVRVGERAPSADVAQAVLALRRSKGMLVDDADHDTWSVGSYFTNPTLPAARAALLPADAPRFDAGRTPDGAPLVKTSAAWLISHAGIPRGWGPTPRATTSTKHVLALTNRGGATAKDIHTLASAITTAVQTTFALTLVPEATIL
jgi:UDP-N-acetylmuramate dehydrogenase